MPLAVVFGTGLDLLGGLCVAAGWPWLVGSSVPPATQAQYSIHHQHCHLLLHVLYHPLLTQVREELLHSSRPPHPPPAVTSVPKLQPSHFQASHPSDCLSGRGITHTPAQCSWSRAHRKESEADNETVPSSRSASRCHHPGFIPWQARLATLLVQGPTWMGALWSHGLAAGWLCLFSRLRLLRLLGLDQLRLSDSDKLESK